MISLWSHPREKYVDLDELFSEHHNNTNSNGGENGDYLIFIMNSEACHNSNSMLLGNKFINDEDIYAVGIW